jgi:hypothetical protein
MIYQPLYPSALKQPSPPHATGPSCPAPHPPATRHHHAPHRQLWCPSHIYRSCPLPVLTPSTMQPPMNPLNMLSSSGAPTRMNGYTSPPVNSVASPKGVSLICFQALKPCTTSTMISSHQVARQHIHTLLPLNDPTKQRRNVCASPLAATSSTTLARSAPQHQTSLPSRSFSTVSFPLVVPGLQLSTAKKIALAPDDP